MGSVWIPKGFAGDEWFLLELHRLLAMSECLMNLLERYMLCEGV